MTENNQWGFTQGAQQPMQGAPQNFNQGMGSPSFPEQQNFGEGFQPNFQQDMSQGQPLPNEGFNNPMQSGFGQQQGFAGQQHNVVDPMQGGFSSWNMDGAPQQDNGFGNNGMMNQQQGDFGQQQGEAQNWETQQEQPQSAEVPNMSAEQTPWGSPNHSQDMWGQQQGVNGFSQGSFGNQPSQGGFGNQDGFGNQPMNDFGQSGFANQQGFTNQPMDNFNQGGFGNQPMDNFNQGNFGNQQGFAGQPMQDGFNQGDFGNMNGIRQQAPKQPEKDGLATASLVLGIAGILLFCVYGGVLSVIGLLLGIISILKKRKSSGVRIGGLITSAIGTIIFVLLIVATVKMGVAITDYIKNGGIESNQEQLQKEVDKEFERQTKEVEDKAEDIVNEAKEKKETKVEAIPLSSELSNDWKSLQIQVQDRILTLPCTQEDIGSIAGFESAYSSSIYDIEEVIEPNNFLYSGFDIKSDYNIYFTGRVVNNTTENAKANTLPMYCIKIEKGIGDEAPANVYLPGGVTWGKKLEDITSIYGEPNDVYEGDSGYKELTYLVNPEDEQYGSIIISLDNTGVTAIQVSANMYDMFQANGEIAEGEANAE